MTTFSHSPIYRRINRPTPCMPVQRTRMALMLALTFSTPFMALHTHASETGKKPEQTLPAVEVSDTTERAANGTLNLDTPVETGSRLGLTSRQNPASITIVDRSTIEARGAEDTQEILKSIPGVTAHNAPGSIGVRFRGFGAVQMYNGIDLQYSIANRAVDSWIYDRVEAIGGPSSFLYGAGAVGGAINTITKTAQRHDISDARLRLGTERMKEASIGINRRIVGTEDGGPAHYARIDLNHRNAGSWVEGTETRSTQLTTSLLSDLRRGLTHTLAYEYQRDDADRVYWGTPVLNPVAGTLRIDERTRFKNYNSADGIYWQRVQWLRSMTDLQVSDALHFKNTFYAYDSQRNYRNVEGYRFDPTNTQIIRSNALLQRHAQRMVGNRIDGTYKGELAGKRSDWSFGLDLSLNKQTRFPNSLSNTPNTANPPSAIPGPTAVVDPYNPITENFFDIPGMTPGYNPSTSTSVRTIAAYLENRTALLPDLNLVTALRHERIELDVFNFRASTPSGTSRHERSYNPTTGRVGLVWDIAPSTMVYVQYATAADPPAGSLGAASPANVTNNTDLTTGRQLEIGSKVDFWQGKGNATVALYSISRKNIATTNPDNRNETLLIGEQSAKGIDVSVGLQPTNRWAIQGNFTYVDAQYEEFYTSAGISQAGNTPANMPAIVTNLWTSYDITPALQASMGVRRIGEVYADTANTLVWPSYTLIDVGLGYKINAKTSLTARIRNLTDRIYAANAGSSSVYLGAPRTADVTLRIAF